jgi:hypothetical protein
MSGAIPPHHSVLIKHGENFDFFTVYKVTDDERINCGRYRTSVMLSGYWFIYKV